MDNYSANDSNFVYIGRRDKKRFCNPITAVATRDADRKFVSVRGQEKCTQNTLDAVENEAERRGLFDIGSACAQSTVSHMTVLRSKNKHRQSAIEQLSSVIACVNAMQLGFDGKKVLGKERYVFNALFSNEGSRGDAMLTVKTFPGSVKAGDVTEVLKTMDQELLKKVFVVIADTTSLNTGCKTGVFRQLKDYFKKEFNRDIHTVECLQHVIELLFRHFFLQLEGPSKAPDKLPKGAFYNLIGKFEIKDELQETHRIKVSPEVRKDLEHFVELYKRFHRDKKAINQLRDDQAGLLAWTCHTVGIAMPAELSAHLLHKQEVHGLARWVTTGSGYLRIYATRSVLEKHSPSEHERLRHICEFVVSIYAPGYLRIFYNPSCADGPQTVLHIRDYLISSFLKYKFEAKAKEQVKKIYVNHALTWLDSENVSLSVFSKNNPFDKSSLQRVSKVLSLEARTKMLWNKRSKLPSFFTAESASAPCLADSSADTTFWQVCMNCNRSCERYIGRIKLILEKRQIRDGPDSDQRMNGIIALQDLEVLMKS